MSEPRGSLAALGSYMIRTSQKVSRDRLGHFEQARL
jgi:hypothetical protein